MIVILKTSKKYNLLDVLFYVETIDEAEEVVKRLNSMDDGYIYKYKNIGKTYVKY